MPVTTACIIQARGRRLGVNENHQKMSTPTDPAKDGGANTKERNVRVGATVVTMWSFGSWILGTDAGPEDSGRTWCHRSADRRSSKDSPVAIDLEYPTPAQPTEPSIWSSMSRLSSTAYSMGSSLTIGSMKPATTIAVACSSVRPRLIR